MCVYSMIVDHYGDKWGKIIPQQAPWYQPPPAPGVEPPPPIFFPPPISPEEIEEFRQLLERAREYDKRNNEPDCELEEKKERVRKLAEELGIGDKIDFL